MDASSWFTDTLTVQSQTGTPSSSGNPAFGSQRSILGTVKQVRRRTSDAKGTTVADVSVFITDQAIAAGDRYWLPGANTGDNTQARRMGTVTQQHDKPGEYTLYQVDL